MESKLNEALRKLAVKLTTCGTASAATGETVDEIIDYISTNFNGAKKITLGTPFIDRYEGTTPIYKVYGEKDLTSFTSGVATHEIEYDASEKRIRACGASASVNYGSPQAWVITSNLYNNIKVEAAVTGGSNQTPKVIYKVTDTKSTPNATTGILYYWYEYTLVD